MIGLKIPAGVIAHGGVYAGASKVQDLDYLRRVERLSADRTVKTAPALGEDKAGSKKGRA